MVLVPTYYVRSLPPAKPKKGMFMCSVTFSKSIIINKKYICSETKSDVNRSCIPNENLRPIFDFIRPN